MLYISLALLYSNQNGPKNLITQFLEFFLLGVCALYGFELTLV